MNLFFFTHAEPRFLPPVLVSTTETVCGPRYNNLRSNGRYRYIHTPGGAFDAQLILSKVRPVDFPEAILVHADSTGGCLPQNLPANCAKILLIGDTHHLTYPIQKMIQYAGGEPFDAIVLWNRQHAHFFTELGFRNVYWLPGLTFAVPTTRQSEEKTNELCFFGQLGKHHPRRTRIIKFLTDEKIEIAGGTLPRRDSLALVAKSRASLNVSLNGEFNLRVFESTQNGALLFSDKLSEFAGLQRFYRDAESIVTYSDAPDLIEKIKHYKSHRQEAEKIAALGRGITNRFFSFSARKETFFNLLNNDDTLDVFRLKDEPRCSIQASSAGNRNATMRRVQIYEIAQELHRTKESPRITLTAGATPFIASDFSDLVRANLTMAIDEESYTTNILPLLAKLGVNNLSRIDPARLPSHSCDLLIVSENDLIAIIPILQKKYFTLCIWDFDPSNVAMHAQILDSGYESVSNTIQGLFQNKHP